MMRMIFTLVACAAVSESTRGEPGAVVDIQELRDKLLHDWAELERLDSRPGAFEAVTVNDQKPAADKDVVKVKRADKSLVLEVQQNGASAVLATNSKYLFVLHDIPSKAEGWMLKLFELDPSAEKTQAFAREIFPGRLTHPLSNLALGIGSQFQKRGTELLADSQFRIASAVELPGRLIKVNYELKPLFNSESSYFIIDLNRLCVVTQVKFNLPGPNQFRYVADRTLDPASSPDAMRMQSLKVTYSNAKLPETTELTTYSNYAPGPVAETDFTLSHYGLPEPEGITWEKPRRRGLYGVMAAGAGLLAAAGLLLRWLRRRGAGPAAPAPTAATGGDRGQAT